MDTLPDPKPASYTEYLQDNIIRTIQQIQNNLEDLRPTFNRKEWSTIQPKLLEMRNLFARIDIILREVTIKVQGRG